MKTCSKCKRELEESCFVKSYHYNDGLHPHCKECRKAARTKRLLENPMCSKCGTLPHYENHPYCPTCMADSLARIKAGGARKVKPQIKLCSKCHVNPRVNNKHLCDQCRSLCPKCKERPRGMGCIYCRVCTNAMIRNRRAKRRGGDVSKRWYATRTDLQRKKLRARAALRNQVKLGNVIPQPCGVCGCLKVEGDHHNGYEKEHWLDVIWFCREHHMAYERWRKKKLTAS